MRAELWCLCDPDRFVREAKLQERGCALRGGVIDDAIGDLRVLVKVVARADPVIAVGDGERDIVFEHAAYDEHRREILTLAHLGEVQRDVRVVLVEEGESTCSQEVFRLAAVDRCVF